MPLYQASSVGNVGLIDPRDRAPFEIPPNAWSRIENSRMLNGSALSVNPWTAMTLTGSIGTDVHALDYYSSAGGAQHIYAYADSAIYSIDSAGAVLQVNKTPLSSDPYPQNIWITDQFNRIPIATNNRDKPQCFYNNGAEITPATVSQDFPDWTTGGTAENAIARIVVGYKNFIVALNIVDGGSAYPNMVWWSDAAEPGLMPANWDYNSAVSISGRTVLGAGSGAILGAARLRDSLFIYTELNTYRMDFTGGTFVMRFTKVFDNFGVFGPRCIGQFGERHFVITKSDIIAHDGQQHTSVGDARVRNRVFEGIDEEDTNRIWIAPYLKTSEMWVGAPEETAGVHNINLALVWQWDEGAWSLRDLPDSRYMRDLPTIQDAAADDTWDGGPDVTWEGGPDNIWDAGGIVGDLNPMVTSTDGNLYFIDQGDQVSDMVLQRSGISLSGDETTDLASDIYIRGKGSEAIQVRVGVSNGAGQQPIWGSYASFDFKTQYRVKCRAKGRRHAIEFRGKNFELEGYDIRWRRAGRR